MDLTDDDSRELERRIHQASRIASNITATTVERLTAWIDELRRKLRQRKEAAKTP
jgi:hypothetical protein